VEERRGGVGARRAVWRGCTGGVGESAEERAAWGAGRGGVVERGGAGGVGGHRGASGVGEGGVVRLATDCGAWEAPCDGRIDRVCLFLFFSFFSLFLNARGRKPFGGPNARLWACGEAKRKILGGPFFCFRAIARFGS
jgi:hypothetical protein